MIEVAEASLQITGRSDSPQFWYHPAIQVMLDKSLSGPCSSRRWCDRCHFGDAVTFPVLADAAIFVAAGLRPTAWSEKPFPSATLIACPHWRQKLPETATNCSRSYSRRKRQQKLPETATFVAVFGNFCGQCGQALK